MNLFKTTPMKTIEQLAQEAGLEVSHSGLMYAMDGDSSLHTEIAKFAALVRAQALEEAAMLCDAQVAVYEHHINTRTGERQERAEIYKDGAEWLAGTIRATSSGHGPDVALAGSEVGGN